MRTIICAAWCVLALAANAQWIGANVPGIVMNYTQVYSPVDRSNLYYCGWNDLDPFSALRQPAILRYNASVWDTLWVDADVNTCVEYHDTLFSGGQFAPNLLDSGIAYNVQYWAQQSWHPVGVFDSWDVRRLRVFDDTLYAVGSFRGVDGTEATGLARLDGSHWVPLPLLPDTDCIVADIIKYEDRLVICGNFQINGATGIAYLENGQWNILGPGILGGLSSIHAMAVYQGDLYVGGQIDMGAGNAGRDIMRWDGTQFQPVGGGLQRNLGDNSGFSDVRGMEEHNGVLYVGGGFRYAGGVPAYGVAGWDGTQWCGVPGNLSDGPGHLGVGQGGMAFYYDTLFVSCGYLADGDSVRLAAKFVGTSYADTCSGPVGLFELEKQVGVQIGYNAELDLITVQAPEAGEVNVFGPLGHVITRVRGRSLLISTAGWSPGVYFVRVDGHPAHKVVVY
jgi:hypothetical protein